MVLLASVSTATAMELNEQGDYFEKVGLATKPLNVTLNGDITHVINDITQKSISEFNNFQILQRTFDNQTSEYMVIKSYILDVLHIPLPTFYKIQDSIRKPLTGLRYMEEALSIPLEALAQLLSTLISTPVTMSEIEAYLRQSTEKLIADERFNLLKYFTIEVLQFTPDAFEQVNSPLVANLNPQQSQKFSTGEFGLVLEYLSVQVGRDIHQEFMSFQDEYNERKSRVLLRKDMEAFFAQTGSRLPARVQSVFVNEAQWSNSTELFLPAIPKKYDISAVFEEKSKDFLTNLCTNMDNRFRVFERFIICRQPGHKIEKAHPDLYKHSLVTIKDGVLYQDGNVLNTDDTIWSLSASGELCIFPKNKEALFGTPNHSHFFQKDSVGLPLACGGHIAVENGKISKISNFSGHYCPSFLQLILAISYFHENGVVKQDLEIDGYSDANIKTFQTPTLKGALSIARMIQLNS
jgi:hypothetical protein